MNTYYIAGFPITDELYHYGIPRQEWGNRRFQYKNGKLTPEGKERYRHASRGERKEKSEAGKMISKAGNSIKTTTGKALYGATKEERKAARKQLSIERGNELISKGRTKGGAIGRGIGREAAIILGHAAMSAIFAGGAIKMMDVMNPDDDAAFNKLLNRSLAVDGMLAAAAIGLTAANTVKTVRQYKDISNAKKSKENK